MDKRKRVPQAGEVWHGQLSCGNRILIVASDAEQLSVSVMVIQVKDSIKKFKKNEQVVYPFTAWQSWHPEDGCSEKP